MRNSVYSYLLCILTIKVIYDKSRSQEVELLPGPQLHDAEIVEVCINCTAFQICSTMNEPDGRYD